jgi:hypothetical protein
MINKISKNWFVVYTKPRHELKVLAMKHYIENTYQLLDKKDHLVGSKIKTPFLNLEAEIISIKVRNCIAQLEILGSCVLFQLS